MNFTLNTGAKIPAVAFGTFGAQEKETYDSVAEALRCGYRHIDCAFYYQNEAAIGRAIRDSGIPRDQLFVTTKLWPTQTQDPEAALEASLEALGLEYLDLYLLHWAYAAIPDPQNKFSWGLKVDSSKSSTDLWESFRTLDPKKARALGVCNYSLDQLKPLTASLLCPAVLQIESHPQLPQTELLEFCRAHGIILEAYCPLANGQVANPTICAVAKRIGADPGQVALSWNVCRGVVVLPKSVTPSRIQSNLKMVELGPQDIQEINKLGKDNRRIINPNFPGTQEKIFG